MLYPCAFRCHLGSVYSRYHILLQKSIVVGGPGAPHGYTGWDNMGLVQESVDLIQIYQCYA